MPRLDALWGALILAGCSSAGEGATATLAGSGGGAAGGEPQGGQGAGGSAGCVVLPACDAAPPDPGATEPWMDPTTPILVTTQGNPQHRVRDLVLAPSDPQWVLAKFTYGPVDKDLVGEKVDVWLLRDCAEPWEMLGTAVTTGDGEHPAVEGVDDTGGRVYFEIPASAALGAGRHRVHLVVKGDLSTADGIIEVLAPGTPVFVADVDGTLTTAETEEFQTLLLGTLPNANQDAATALGLLAARGVHPFYLTARPEWLGARTREFLGERGFPVGIVHTTLAATGATGQAAADYKTDELSVLAADGIVPLWAFGNTGTDADAYDAAGIQPLEERVFFQFDDAHGGRRIESYTELLPELEALPCQ